MTRTLASHPLHPGTLAAVLMAALLAGGCSSIGNLLGGDKVDYRSGARQTTGLEVPPDLTQLARDGRYQAPSSVVSAAGTTSAAAAGPGPAASPTVALSAIGGITLERDGDTRWLRVPAPPERIWPRLQQFWADAGFALEIDNAQIGVIETAWAENRAKLPDDILRRTLGRVFENLYDTGERDRFRMRVERTANGSEIFLTHRGLIEVYTDRALKDEVRWQRRPADRQLEAEFLSRIMVALGTPAAGDGATVASTPSSPSAPAQARMMTGQPTASIELDTGFDSAWRRVGLALDRSGFTVEDRDRSAGLYFVRYADTRAANDDRGFLAKLFGSDDAAPAQRYRIRLAGGGAADKTIVSVQTGDGNPAPDAVGQRIATVLVDALK